MEKKVFKMDASASLILEGGGMRGAFTAGVLDNFMDRGIRFPYVIGVSAGACNALSYMSHQRGRSKYSYTELMKQYKYIGIKKLLFRGNIMDFNLLFHKYPEEISPYDYNRLANSPERFEMVTTSCLSGKACYYDEKNNPKRIIEIVKASSSLPFASPITYVDGVPMLDGGIADSIPVEYAMSQGYEKIVVVLTRNKGYRKKPGTMPLRKIFYRKYPQLQKALAERNAVYNRTMDLIEKLEEEGRIAVIRPQKPVEVGRMEKDTAKLTALYEEGYEETRKFLS